MADEPRLVEVSISSSMGGKIQIESHGKMTSDYFVSFGRRYSVPEGWTDDDADDFQNLKYIELRDQVDTLAQAEFDERLEQSFMNPDREVPPYNPGN